MKKILKYIRAKWWYLLILGVLIYFTTKIWIDILWPEKKIIKVHNVHSV